MGDKGDKGDKAIFMRRMLWIIKKGMSIISKKNIFLK